MIFNEKIERGISRKKFIFFICILGCLCCILLTATNRLFTNSVYKNPHPLRIVSHSFAAEYTKDFKLNTTGCILENIPLWSQEAIKFFRRIPPINCSKGNDLNNVTFLRDKILTITKEDRKKLSLANAECRYRSIKRRTGEENSPSVGQWKSVNYMKNIVIEDEFIHFHCHEKNNTNKLIYENFHAQAIVKQPAIKKPFNKYKRSNIILISIDSISANSLKRNMPKVWRFLKKKLGAFEMDGFLKIDGPTIRNFIGMLTGLPFNKVKKLNSKKWMDNVDFIWNDFAKNGYVRYYGEDRPRIGTFNYMVKGFNKQPIEYWSKPFELVSESHRIRKKAVPDSCYGETSSIKVLHNYFLDLLRVNNGKDIPVWGHVHQSHHVHADFNGLSAVEDDYLKFFESIIDRGLHKNSYMFFFSDHGVRYGDFRQTYVGRVEQHMPFLYVIPPVYLKEKYPEYVSGLETNTHRLTTLYDVYQTMHHLLHIEGKHEKKHVQNSKRNGQSLFFPISAERNCSTAPLLPIECLCATNKKISKNSKIVQNGAEFAVENMNNRIKAFNKSKVCLRLSLQLVMESTQLSKNENKFIKILLTILVKPSKGILEVLIGYTHDTKQYSLLSDFDRINEYGNESHCVNDREIKSICYCKKQFNRVID